MRGASAAILLNNHGKTTVQILIFFKKSWDLKEKLYICRQISVSWKEMDIFAKQTRSSDKDKKAIEIVVFVHFSW